MESCPWFQNAAEARQLWQGQSSCKRGSERLLCEDVCNEAPGTLETIKQPPRKDAGMTEAGSRDRLCVLGTAGLAMLSFFTVISQSAFARQQAGNPV